MRRQFTCDEPIENALHKKPETPKMTIPSLFGKTLHLSHSTAYLGLIPDEEPNWNKHVNERVRNATKIFWQCKCAFGKRWI